MSVNSFLRNGFVIAEVLVGLLVLVLLVAITVPVILDSGSNSNELSAVASVKSILSAIKNYKVATGNLPKDLMILANNKPPLLDALLAGGLKDGYAFTYKITGAGNFMVIARPQSIRGAGIKSFFADVSGVIRWTNADAQTQAADQLLQ